LKDADLLRILTSAGVDTNKAWEITVKEMERLNSYYWQVLLMKFRQTIL